MTHDIPSDPWAILPWLSPCRCAEAAQLSAELFLMVLNMSLTDCCGAFGVGQAMLEFQSYKKRDTVSPRTSGWIQAHVDVWSWCSLSYTVIYYIYNARL